MMRVGQGKKKSADIQFNTNPPRLGEVEHPQLSTAFWLPGFIAFAPNSPN